MSIALTVLAVLGVLVSLGAAVATLANVRVSPLVVLGGLFGPLILGVLTTRWSAESAVHTALEEGSVFTWMERAGPGIADAWTAIAWPSWVVLLGAPLVVLLSAIAGAMRKKRRLVLFGVGIGSLLLCVALSFGIGLMVIQDLEILNLAAPAMLALVGIPAAVSLMAGGEKGGPAAAGISTVAAAAAVTATSLAFIASSEHEGMLAVATAPLDMRVTMAAAARSYVMPLYATAVLPLAAAIGLAAMGLGAGTSTGRTTLGTLVLATLVPLSFIGADTSSATAIGNAAIAAIPPLEPRGASLPGADWELPTALVHKGTAGIEIEAGGDVRFIPAEGAPTALSWPLSGDVILGLAPAEGPSPILLVDRAVPADAVARAVQAVRTGRNGPVAAGVKNHGAIQSWELDLGPASERCTLVGPEMGCADGQCTTDDMPRRLGPELCVHPQASWGLVVAAAGAVGYGAKIAFLAPEEVAVEVPAEE